MQLTENIYLERVLLKSWNCEFFGLLVTELKGSPIATYVHMYMFEINKEVIYILKKWLKKSKLLNS